MMKLRKRALPSGWYPDSPDEIRDFLASVSAGWRRGGAAACAAPHAGWFFSGSLAARSVCSLDPDAETIVVLGGHLPPGRPILYTREDGAETPLGIIEIDGELRAALEDAAPGMEDRYVDNTIEVELPLVRYFFPEARLLAMRLPSDEVSITAGRALAEAVDRLGRKAAVIASTDLTHYGADYDFAPRGFGPEALEWMKTENDRAFINAVLHGTGEEILKDAAANRSACSPGAVAAAHEFAAAAGAHRPELLAYTTSADVLAEQGMTGRGFSAVGYASIGWFR